MLAARPIEIQEPATISINRLSSQQSKTESGSPPHRDKASEVSPKRPAQPPAKPEEPSQRQSVASETCSGRQAFRSLLQGRLDATLDTVKTPWVEVDFRQQSSEEQQGVLGHLRLVPSTDPSFDRRVLGANCDEVMRALSFAFEIYLDGRRDTKTPPCKEPQKTDQPASSVPDDWPGPDLDPFSLPPAGPRDPSPPPQWPLPTPVAEVRAGVSLGWSVLPTTSFGMSMGAQMKLGSQTVALVELHQHLGGPLMSGEDLYSFSTTAVSFAFVRRAPTRSAFSFAVGLGPRASLIHATWGRDRPVLTHHGTVALQLHGEMAVTLGPAWTAGLRVRGLFNVLRAHFLSPEALTVWEQPWAGGEAGAFLGATFW